MTAGALNATEFKPTALPTYSPIHQERNPALARRRIEGHRRRAHRRDQGQADHLEAMRAREHREQQRGARHRHVGHEEHAAAREAIGHDPGERREQENRRRARRADDPQIERRLVRRARHPSDEVAHRGELHPRPEVRNEQPEPEQPKIAETQRREHRTRRGHPARARTAATMSAVDSSTPRREASMQRS